jgi:L,D-transpeptidase-like protein
MRLSIKRSSFRATAPALWVVTNSLFFAIPNAHAAKEPIPTPVPELRPLVAVVSVGDQHVSIWAGDSMVARAPVSTGMEGHRTPLGVFSVIGKERYHESNLYSNAPMPYMQRITWSGVAMHAGVLPGYPASHGCIRMPYAFAEKLYSMTKMGMRVVVTNQDLKPVVFEDPHLPIPTYVRASEITKGSAGATREAVLTPVAVNGRMQLGGPDDSADRLLNPMERGKLEQSTIKSAALEAQSDVQALIQVAAQRSADVRIADEAARRADAARVSAASNLEKAKIAAQNPALTDDEKLRAADTIKALEAAAAAATKLSLDAHATLEATDASAFAAAAETKQALQESELLEHAARVATHATEPVSVFVSRKEHRVYVRQGFEPVLEADIDIADADAPIGTHVFTAIGVQPDGNALSWINVSIQGAAQNEATRPRRGKAGVMTEERPAPAGPLTAANALARVKFSDELRQKISAKAWTGASLIISDLGLSSETGVGTDFVILTH